MAVHCTDSCLHGGKVASHMSYQPIPGLPADDAAYLAELTGEPG
jgi:hypothetical protein